MSRLVPMPSPNGTNFARLYVPAELVGAAYDAAPRGLRAGDQSPLLAALKRKFRTPQAALRALGLDASLLEENKMPSNYTRFTPARDQEPADAEMCIAFIRTLLESLEPEEADELRTRLADLAERGAEDEPEPFPGRPRPGGSLDPLERAEDARRRRHYAQDSKPYRPIRITSASQRNFDRRFPGAARIRVGMG